MINNLLAHAVVSRLSSLVSSLLFSLLSPAVLRDRRQSPKRPITTLHEDLNRRFLGPRIGGRRRPARGMRDDARRQRTTDASRVVGDRGAERRLSVSARARIASPRIHRKTFARVPFDRRRGNGREGRWRRRARRRRAMRGRARCSRRTGRSRARVSVHDGSARTPRRARTRRWRGKVRGDETRRDETRMARMAERSKRDERVGCARSDACARWMME